MGVSVGLMSPLPGFNRGIHEGLGPGIPGIPEPKNIIVPVVTGILGRGTTQCIRIHTHYVAADLFMAEAVPRMPSSQGGVKMWLVMMH